MYTQSLMPGHVMEFWQVPNSKNPPENDGKNGALYIFVIYGPNTADYFGRFPVRRNIVKGHENRVEIDKDPIFVGETIEAARGAIPPRKKLVDRQSSDDPVILETWL